jgi:tRNA A37 threonylcarbamoyladenosine dehydratase
MELNLDTLNSATLRLIERDSVNLILVGCGGTGSWLSPTVVRTARLLIEKFNKQVQMVFVDSDTVEPKNCYRQNFAEFEIGQNKAETLARRYGLAWGLDVLARPCRFDAELDKLLSNEHQTYYGLSVVIGCVDNAPARAEIQRYIAEKPVTAQRAGGWTVATAATVDRFCWAVSTTRTIQPHFPSPAIAPACHSRPSSILIC